MMHFGIERCKLEWRKGAIIPCCVSTLQLYLAHWGGSMLPVVSDIDEHGD